MSWVDNFVSFTSNTTSPELFRRWAGISTIACALERRTWVVTYGSKLYPNLYIVLCAPPGVGKTEVLWRIRDVLEYVDELNLAAPSLTKASLIDELNEAERSVVRPQDNPSVIKFNSLSLIVNELGVLLPAYENDFMNTLTDLYDCKFYAEKRRTNKLEINIPAPQINMIAGTTPSYLNSVIPEGAWDQGFLSRTLLIYTGERHLRELFDVLGTNDEESNSLKEGIAKISDIYGEIKFTDEAKELINNWHLSGGPPSPEHPKLIHYSTRRTAHLLKLCQIACVESRLELVIRPEDFNKALDWLIEAEHYMPEIFKAMSSVGTGKTMEEAWFYLFQAWTKDNKPVQEHRLIQFLQEKVPIHHIKVTIEMMEKSGIITPQLTKTGKAYVPRGKKPNSG
ncbi:MULTISPECIES: DUF3987 domain-containing protein [unclassified Roseobacter]|uniref:DUF3987 domain-containing protein n=1 Tax=unclassified Roseobacter TaxID=196798 RepID=UPI001490BAC6|nr:MULTISPECIES: DUF3987 domain-containing protein [unclassified Roseobacter]NNW55495.1 DUF3987 domain-containing protein [Roseobacter sp. HKCCD8284]NNY17318.1 DUF3987 domain-containing protein [Roseobacter sp. HKCCD8191]